MKALLPALLLLLPCAARAQKFDAETREFASRNGAFRLSVSYSGSGGAGRVRASLTGASGKKISAFEADRAPVSVTVSGDGRRLFFFCGSWGNSVSIYSVDVYSSSGERLAGHQVRMSGPAGEDFSDDYSLYALGADLGDARTVMLIDSATGRLLWRKRFDGRLAGLKLAGSGGRLLVLFADQGKGWRASVFDKSGRELGGADVKADGNLTPRVFSRDGGSFELWEDRTVYSAKDGYWHARLVGKRYFKVSPSGVEAAGEKKLDEDFR